MRILLIASEALPFAKTGGLADVAGSLPLALVRRGHDVRIIMPLYASVDRFRFRLLPLLRRMEVQWGSETIPGGLMRTSHPGDTQTPVYFVQQDGLFNRKGLYGANGSDYSDNDKRFGFFCLAALWAIKGLDWQPDILHLNDWQTGAVAPLLRHHPAVANDPFYRSIRTVFTIHNLAYQGIVSEQFLPQMQLPWNLFTSESMEFHRKTSLLKAGIALSDRITTVSPTYAREIQTPEEGMGLDGLLRSHSDRLHGILNGIDTDVWNPETDPYLPSHYSKDNLAGKAECKKALREAFGISADPDSPHIGIVSRLVGQKGFDLVGQAAAGILRQGATISVLGTGDKDHEDFFTNLAANHPGRVGVKIAYREDLAHLTEGGSDFFLMPSRFEPSGLNQLYSMRYGTIPIVRNVGGLADSVSDAGPENLESGVATGIVFDEYSADALFNAVLRGLSLYKEGGKAWSRLVRNAMSKDFSWDQAAEKYEGVYELAMSSR